jgi:hypothetical protein
LLAQELEASLADWPALAALPVSGQMTPIFTGSAAYADVAATSSPAMMHYVFFVVSSTQ